MVEPCSVIIPTKNGGVVFAELLRSLALQTIWREVELIVVDSGSEDDTVELAKRAGAKVITVLPERFNHGTTRDLAISHARNDHVVLMVQDALPTHPSMLQALVAPLRDEQVAGVYARQLPRPNADVLTKRNLSAWRTGRTVREVRVMPNVQWYEKLSPMEKYLFCSFDNVCAAVNRTIWRHDPFGMVNFGEDIAWAERVLKRGYKIVFEPAASVIHSHDRGMRYEYHRTYICHRQLYRLFGLHLVPTLRTFALSWLASSSADIAYVFRTEERLPERMRMLFRVPALNCLSGLAQYRAVRDVLDLKSMPTTRGV